MWVVLLQSVDAPCEDVEPQFNRIETAVHFVLKAIEPAANAFELAANAIEPAVNAIEPAANRVEPVINPVEPVIYRDELTVNSLEVLVVLQKMCVDSIEPRIDTIKTRIKMAVHHCKTILSRCSEGEDCGHQLARVKALIHPPVLAHDYCHGVANYLSS